MGFWNFRSLLFAAIVLCNSITWTVSKHHYTHNVLGHRSRHRRQGAGLYLSSSYVIPGGEGGGAWGEWGEVSPCSRSCGGGVASQKRICLEVSPDGRPRCTGGDTKYFSCQTQDCPEGSGDFRAEQCSEYDDIPFRGIRYKWVPYTKAPNPCALTCMPQGERFYRPINNVVDGTRCYEDSFDVCVNGTCQPVGCDMMLGSNAREDKCRECRGNGTNCRTVTGRIDTQDLVQGYNDILIIPQGATNILIAEIRPSNNYLALRSKQDNEYYLNGHYHIDFPRTLPIAGANWRYERSQQGYAAPDILKCLGPTNETLYLSLLLQEANVGVDYEYSIPTAIAPPPSQEYNWVHDEFSPCSATCGGGYQTRRVTCRSREELEEVDERLCDSNMKPVTSQACGTRSCEARWVEGPWSPCSKPCGEGGTRSRQVHCEKIISNGYPSVIPDEECFAVLGPKPELYQECKKDEACPTWFTGPWKPCDKLCGEGKQTRQVVCHQRNGGRVEVLSDDACADEKPPAEQACILHPCDGVDWVLTDWSGCDTCLSKVRTRTAVCATKGRQVVNASLCSYHPTPVLEEPCDQGKLPPCTVQWYATQWSNCSVECGKGVQTRRVFCGLFNGESVVKVDNDRCDNEERYNDTKPCEIPADKCPAKWFAGPWSECDKKCGGGEQYRKVMCFSGDKEASNCDENTLPEDTQSCNQKPCDKDETLPIDAKTTPIMDEEDDYDEDCEDEDYTEEVTSEEGIFSSFDSTMFSDAPSTTDGSGFGSTSFAEIETEFTAETGSGFEDTEGTGSTVTEETESTVTDITESTVTEETESTVTEITESTVTEETGSTVTEETGSTVTEDTVSTVTEETGSTVTEETVSTVTEETGSTVTEETVSTVTEETGSTVTEETGSTMTEETGSTGSTATEETGSTITEDTDSTITDFTSTTELTTTESDETSTTESGTTESGSTASGTTESDTTESGTTESGTTESGTTESGTTESGTTESGTTESGTTESGMTESGTTESGSTESDATETTTESESGTTEESVSTSEGSTDTEITSETLTTEGFSSTSESTTESSSTETGSTDTEITEITESTITESTVTDETGTTETGESSTTETGESTTPWDWTSTVEFYTNKPKCKLRKKAKCIKSRFGCCPDKKTAAAGPFDEGCPNPKTCKETPHGCCPDGVSPANGPKNKGCPIPPCNETLYGCCKSDKTTPAEGNNQEGCPPPPPACKSSKHGCCKDGKTQAKGPKGKGCPENAPKVKGCADSEFGCCFDNKTQASGPNEEGCPCDITEFGCCPDGVSPARGAQMEGCVLSCNTSAYGCCPDQQTPAHGPNNEGCCLTQAFGCCPDNYRPAEGPHLEGCGCQYSYYGCCPDNVTIARGPNSEGCGCKYTEHGCCPDRNTEASGPNFEGCKCHTYQFGCCPDGVTPATGQNGQGCRCDESEFGCCGDGQTAATGPNKQGCDCSNSKYGCCPDGQTEATGEKFAGCTDVPVDRQKACGLPTDRGPCQNYSVFWFYDQEYGGCSRFWYGGCEGNGNRFTSNEECQDVCVNPPKKDACKLPKVKGACKSYIRRWYYDSEREQCGQFEYGGCLGNANNFESRELCQSQCEPPRDEATCELEIDRGECAGSFRRWGFNSRARRCEQFVWGGCGGNDNRFAGEAACVQRCDPPGALKPVCTEPQAAGNCSQKLAVWSFSLTENRCVPFYYTGCGGNNNSFPSLEECSKTCPSVPVEDVCTMAAAVGDCAEYRIKWYYDTALKRCRQFYYGGCGGNGNNFNSEQECENRCSEQATTTTTTVQPQPPPQYSNENEFCFLEKDPGPCNKFETRYAYDSSLGQCVPFQYGGCGGNNNNFPDISYCNHYCTPSQDICQLPMRAGSCGASIMNWFYDARTDSCSQFTYSGCEGNGNRFESREDCESRCRSQPAPQQTTQPATTVTDAPEQLPAQCRISPTLEPCYASGPVWYYEPSRRECVLHDNQPSGPYCRNRGVFASQEFCERNCGTFRNLDVCRYPVDPGPCRAMVPKVFFNAETGSCEEFQYGGCHGGPNRFSSIIECQEICNPDPCQLPQEPGNCLSSIEAWYYDHAADECTPFYYSGCQGNANRFSTRDECEGRCRRVPAPTPIPAATQVTPSEQECRTPESLIPCGENITVFYYDAERRTCVASDIGGCRYANSYRTEEECERRCGAFRGIDVCRTRLDPGPCLKSISKFYFDLTSGRCEMFAYGGCLGGPNRFSTEDECLEVCGSVGPDEECLEPMLRGAECGGGGAGGGAAGGAGGGARRWFYSLHDADCLGFIYEGCDGNRNNFGSYAECETKCIRSYDEPSENEIDCSAFEQECDTIRCEYGIQRMHTSSGCNRCSCITNDVDCTRLKEECDTLRCNYGIDKTLGDDGCERCRCIKHPCEKKQCPSGERCVATPYRDPDSQETKYSADCKIISKPGECPAAGTNDTADTAGACRRECNDDADCAGGGKCCARGCSRRCELPAPPPSAAPSTPAPPPRSPELPQAPQASPERTPPEVTSAEGGTATLRCFFHGNPPPTITWRRGELTIDGNASRYLIHSDGSLEIVSLYRNDSGVYICVADNGLGTARQEVHLQVTDPVEQPAGIAGAEGASETGELGQPLTLRCLAYGYPTPSIYWYHGPNGGSMVPYDSQLFEARDKSLLIRTLNLETLGEYSCQAYNGVQRPASWTVTVRAWAPAGHVGSPYLVQREVRVTPRPEPPAPPPPPAQPDLPVYTVPVMTRLAWSGGVVAAGSELTLPCEVDGYPDPTVHWTRDGATLLPDERVAITDARLTISAVMENDTGVYGCHASNAYSSHYSTVSIEVRGIFVPKFCTDNPFFANCTLIVMKNFCKHQYYSMFCCKSCVESGQLDPASLRPDAQWQYRRK